MTDKKRTSISVDKDVYQFLQQSEVNQSGLIQELVREYRNNQDRKVAALELRYKHLMNEADEAEARMKRKRKQAEEVAELLETERQEEAQEIKEAREAMSGIDFADVTPENPAVQHQAKKVGMEPQQLLETLRNNTT